MQLAQLISIYRRSKSWSLDDLERATGVAKSTIVGIESGEVRDPSISTVIRITDSLDVPLELAMEVIRASANDPNTSGRATPDASPLDRELPDAPRICICGMTQRCAERDCLLA
ncbi:MAG: helix-turn-helix transcriptional regulator [Proteobacteria bacterium]|nr:helix-turn-helix transcriptional regulator [Pseudomonadota bacterium]